LGVSDELSKKESELESLRKRHAELTRNAGDDDPAVKQLSEEISVLSKQVEEQRRIRRQTRTNSAEDELNRQIRKRDDIQRKINEYSRKSQMSPLVQSEYSKLAQDYDNASRQYNETLAKLTDAKVAKEIEDTQLGERFLVIEEPRVPLTPEKPNRLKIMLAGLFLSLFAGLFVSIVMENLDHAIKSPEQLRKITKVPVLTIMPYVITDEEKKARSQKNIISKVFEDLRQGASNLARKEK